MLEEQTTQPQVEEDVILPDDFEAESTEQTESVEDTTPTEEVDTQQETEQQDTKEEETTEEAPQTIKIKFNHEEKELPVDEAIPLVQKGMNYDKVQEKLQQLESDPRLSFVEELANQNGMTTEQFIDVFKQQQEQEKLNELVQKNIPEDLAQEILENRKFRQQFESEKKAKENEEKETQEFTEFFQYFKDVNGKDFDPDKDKIPADVLEAHQNGVPLKFAYMEHQNKQLQQQLQVKKQNEENLKKAPVQGVTEHGSTEVESTDPFLQGFDSI